MKERWVYNIGCVKYLNPSVEALMLISEEEKRLEASWKESGVLRELNPGNLPLSEKAVVFSCFDERYVSQWLDHVMAIASQKQERAVPALFPVIGAGFPLVVAPSSPIHDRFDHRGMIELNLEMAKENGCRDATIIGHYPCLAGHKHGINLLNNAALLVVGKRWLSTKGVEAAIIIDIKHKENAPCEPWHLKANEFEAWCQKQHPEILDKYPGIRRVV